MNVNVKRESFVKVLGHSVRVPNCFIVGRRPWSAAKIARAEQQAQALGDLQTFVIKSPLFPFACVAAFFAFMYSAVWFVETVVAAIL